MFGITLIDGNDLFLLLRLPEDGRLGLQLRDRVGQFCAQPLAFVRLQLEQFLKKKMKREMRSRDQYVLE